MKKPLISLFLIFCLITGLPLRPLSQSEQKPPVKPQYSTNTTAVLLDAVVKDKRGRVVKDLMLDDFEVYEDGVRQKVDTFELISNEAEADLKKNEPAGNKESTAKPETPAVKKPEKSPVEAQVGVSAIAMVFDRLSPDARNRARESALQYIGENKELQAYVGVFAINLSLSPIQPYTRDAQLVRKAIETAGSRVSSSFTSTAQQARDSSFRQQQLAQASASAMAAASAGGAGAGAAGSAAGAADAEATFAEMTRRSLETFETLERNQQGIATSNGLLSLISGMRNLPGRKAVIYFSEGIAIPPDVAAQFHSVINAANRANVSIYSVDSAGLRTESPVGQSADNINSLAARRTAQLASNTPSTSGAMMKQLELNEDFMRQNPQVGLIQLAQDTGGAFVGDNNNVGERLKQVDADLNTYYMLSYTSTNENYDGKYRQILVKLKRGGLDVQARKGYYAVSTPGYVTILSYETPAFAAMNRLTPPNDFPIRTLGFNFPDATRQLHTVVEVEAPANVFTFAEDKAKKIFSTNFVILALIRDESNQIVAKLSRQYALTGPLDKINATRNSSILFYREADLTPGRYTIESIAYDGPTEKASLRRSTIEIPEVSESKLRLSTVSIVNRVEQVPATQKADSPFQVGEVMLYPNLGEAFKKSTTKQIGFYFVVYPVKGSKKIPQLTLQVVQGKKIVADVQLKLTAADANGRIPYASALPIESLTPGSYELRITIKDEQSSVTRSQLFSIEP